MKLYVYALAFVAAKALVTNAIRSYSNLGA
jgi:hypothetical protein